MLYYKTFFSFVNNEFPVFKQICFLSKSNKFLLINYEAVIFYGITLIFAVTVCFVFFNIINNPDLADQAIAKSGGYME